MLGLFVFALKSHFLAAFYNQKVFHLTKENPSYALHGTGLAWKRNIKLTGCIGCTFLIDYSKPGCNDSTGHQDNLSILCYDDFPFLLAGQVPDISGCTQAWATCEDFQQFQFQCSWEILGSEIELRYRPEMKIPGDYFAVSIRVQEWVEGAPRYLLFSVWPASDKSCVHINYAIVLETQTVLTCVARFEPETYTTMLPYNFFRMLSDDDDGALLEIYAGGYPGKNRTTLIGSTTTSQADQQLDSFAAAVTFINRDEDQSISIGPEISKIAIDNVIITPNSNAPTFLSSFKYPWVFEEDPGLFKPTIITVNYNQITCTLLTIDALEGGTLEVGFTDNNVQISARKNYTSESAGLTIPLTKNIKQLKFLTNENSTNDGGFRVVIYGNDIARGGLTTPKISPDEPNFLLNLVDIFADEGNAHQFTAVVDGLVSETNITYTLCSLHHNITMDDRALGYDDCTTSSRSELMAVFLDCCSKTCAVSNGQQINFDLNNLTTYSGAPTAFLIRLHENPGNTEQPTVWTLPYAPSDDEELNFQVPASDTNVFVAISLPPLDVRHFRGSIRGTNLSPRLVMLKDIYWPHSTLECNYHFYPGIVTGANGSVPLTTFRGTEDFYPQFLFTGSFTLEVPAKCRPTISLNGGEIINAPEVILTECTGMRLVVAPGYNSLEMSSGAWMPTITSWACSPPVDMTFELVDLVDATLGVTFRAQNGTFVRNYTSTETTRDLIKVSNVSKISMTYAGLHPNTSAKRYGYFVKLHFKDGPATTSTILGDLITTSNQGGPTFSILIYTVFLLRSLVLLC